MKGFESPLLQAIPFGDKKEKLKLGNDDIDGNEIEIDGDIKDDSNLLVSKSPRGERSGALAKIMQEAPNYNPKNVKILDTSQLQIHNEFAWLKLEQWFIKKLVEKHIHTSKKQIPQEVSERIKLSDDKILQKATQHALEEEEIFAEKIKKIGKKNFSVKSWRDYTQETNNQQSNVKETYLSLLEKVKKDKDIRHSAKKLVTNALNTLLEAFYSSVFKEKNSVVAFTNATVSAMIEKELITQKNVNSLVKEMKKDRNNISVLADIKKALRAYADEESAVAALMSLKGEYDYEIYHGKERASIMELAISKYGRPLPFRGVKPQKNKKKDVMRNITHEKKDVATESNININKLSQDMRFFLESQELRKNVFVVYGDEGGKIVFFGKCDSTFLKKTSNVLKKINSNGEEEVENKINNSTCSIL